MIREVINQCVVNFNKDPNEDTLRALGMAVFVPPTRTEYKIKEIVLDTTSVLCLFGQLNSLPSPDRKRIKDILESILVFVPEVTFVIGKGNGTIIAKSKSREGIVIFWKKEGVETKCYLLEFKPSEEPFPFAMVLSILEDAYNSYADPKTTTPAQCEQKQSLSRSLKKAREDIASALALITNAQEILADEEDLAEVASQVRSTARLALQAATQCSETAGVLDVLKRSATGKTTF